MDPQRYPPAPRPLPMRPPRAWVVRDASAEEARAEVDWTRWYVTDEDDIGSSFEQQFIIQLFLACLHQLAFERGWTRVLVSTDVFFGWVKDHPLVRVSPDVFLVDDPPDPLPRSMQTWREGHKPPRFALEAVSVAWRKDYEDAPERYAQLGCRELVIFDPAAPAGASGSRRARLTIFRRASDGAFLQMYSGDGPAYSEELEAWLVVTLDGERPRLRLARDEYGTDLVPTAHEVALLEEEKRAAAEARIRELEEQLRKLQGK